jgi:hypothetical protein
MWIGGAVLTLVYSFIFLRDVLSGTIVTDAAKYALNIPYPHPPLGRWLMLGSQAIFGSTIFAARLPSFLAEAVAVGLFFVASKKRWSLFFLALSPAFLLWIGQGYQTSFLLLAVSLVVYGTTREQSDARLAWITVGYLLAIWTQLQGVFLLPAVLMFFFVNRRAVSFKIFLATILAHTFLVALWLAGSPLAVADAIHLAGTSPSFIDNLRGSIAADFFPLACLLVALCVAHLVRWRKQKRITVETGAMLVSSIIFLSYLFTNPAPYYVPYVLAICYWGLIEFRTSSKNVFHVLLATLIIYFAAETSLIGPSLIHPRPPVNNAVSDLRLFLADRDEVMALGYFGYDRSYVLGKTFVHFASDPTVRDRIKTVIVFRPETLTIGEEEFLSTFEHHAEYGGTPVYTK